MDNRGKVADTRGGSTRLNPPADDHWMRVANSRCTRYAAAAPTT
jgi:hypothetical protein